MTLGPKQNDTITLVSPLFPYAIPSLTLFSDRRAASVTALLPTTTTLIYAHLLAARFLIIIRTPAEGWSLLGATLRLAQALGLHRDGARLGLPSAETERRRRLWSHLFYADASMCLMLGRPMGVRVGDCDVQEPGKVRLEEDAEDEAAAGDADIEYKVTRWTFMALRHRLAQITSRVIEHFQDLTSGRHYDTVIELDRELVKFWEALPALYKIEGGERLRERNSRGRDTRPSQDRDRDRDRSASRSRDREGSSHPDEPMEDPERGQPRELGEEPGAYPFLALHRFMINTEVQYVRIALHRPYVLRAGEKYVLDTPCFSMCTDEYRSGMILHERLVSKLLGLIADVVRYSDARSYGQRIGLVVTIWAVYIDYSSAPFLLPPCWHSYRAFLQLYDDPWHCSSLEPCRSQCV